MAVPLADGSTVNEKLPGNTLGRSRKAVLRESDASMSEEHTKGMRPSTRERHQKGQARKTKDKKGGEKADARRPHPPRKRRGGDDGS
jgi:hypothetical protein